MNIIYILILQLIVMLALLNYVNAVRAKEVSQNKLIESLYASIAELDSLIDLLKKRKVNKRVIEVAPDYRAGAYDRLHSLAIDLEMENTNLKFLIRQVLTDLPQNKDWLSPEIENLMKEMSKSD